jgi:hypothetical protein
LVSDPALAKQFYQDDLAALASDEMCVNERPYIAPSGGSRHVLNTRGKVCLSNGRRLLIVFGIDIFSVLVIAAVHFAVIIGLVGARHQGYVRKSMHLMTLLFLGMFNGLFVAADIYSFYIFFEALLLPLWLLIGMFGEIRRQPVILRFFIYNFLGALFLFIATAVLYHHEGHNLALDAVSRLQLNRHLELCIWGAIFGCFYPLYKGLGKSAGLLLLVNVLVAFTLMSVDSTLGLIINCAVAGFVAPKLMLKQLNDDKWTEVKE